MEAARRAAVEGFDYFTALSSLMGLKIKPSTSQVALFIPDRGRKHLEKFQGLDIRLGIQT